MSKNYRFIEDPGHGWLEVPVKEIESLGIGNEISSYSYIRGSNAYLEEDCDLTVFLKAKKAAGEPVEMSNVYQENTPVRGYDRWGHA